MIDNGEYLWNCMRYIDLNMVRTRTVTHPLEWRWCGFHELTGEQKRYRMLDTDEILTLHDGCSAEDFAENYRCAINDSIERDRLRRDPMWTESIAVGLTAAASRTCRGPTPMAMGVRRWAQEANG